MVKQVWVYDLETLPNFFCAVFKNKQGQVRVFEISEWKNDYEILIHFLKTEVEALKGYNNISFDAQVIEFIWYNEKSANEIALFANKVIDSEFPIYPDYKFHIFNLDIYKILHLDNKNRRVGLKWCEYMIDWPTIEDMPFYREVRTREEADAIIHYCKNDVNATEHLFDINKKAIQLRIDLSAKYNINFLNASNSKIGSELMLKLYCARTRRNSYEVRRLRTKRDIIKLREIIFPYIKFESDEFSGLLNYFKDKVITQSNNSLEKSVIFKGFQFDYGLGGIHGSVKNRIVTIEDDEVLKDADVASLYPSIAVVNKLYPEHLGYEFAEVYGNDIVAVRLGEKAKGKDGDKAIIDGLKEAANSVYGKSNDEYSWLQDYQYTLATTVNGQLMLTMLAEKLMTSIPNLELIQINTDGLTCKFKKQYEDQYNQICKEWEEVTKLQLEYAYYSKMVIRDVNNYCAVYTNGKFKCKGSFEYEDLPLHKNKSALITRIAVFNYFVNNIPIEDTIRKHTNILDFCIGIRAKQETKLFSISNEGKEQSLPKTIRYFISNKGKVFKKRYGGGNVEYLNVHPQKGRTFYQSLLNEYDDTLASNFDINYTYYIHKTKNDIEIFKEKLTLF